MITLAHGNEFPGPSWFRRGNETFSPIHYGPGSFSHESETMWCRVSRQSPIKFITVLGLLSLACIFDSKLIISPNHTHSEAYWKGKA